MCSLVTGTENPFSNGYWTAEGAIRMARGPRREEVVGLELAYVGGCRKSDFLAGINVDSYTKP